ncbi:MAG TPA: chromate transporter [Firmicutes bacterium]|jgi:chromate transporter|nr:chromate transporter [Bacillota bacterium]
MNYLQIFLTFLKIGATTFGGGYAMLPVIRQEVVNRHSWLGEEEFIDALAVAQSLPGAVAINTAVFVGYKVKGLPGSLAALLGAVLPSFLVILLVAAFFVQFIENRLVAAAFAGIRPVVAALIAFAVMRLGKTVFRKKFGLILFFLFLLPAVFLRFNPILLIIVGAAAGLLREALQPKPEREKGDAR